MPSIPALLHRLEATVLAQSMPVSMHLARPVNPGDVEERLSRLGLPAPASVKAVFEWHNGYEGEVGTLPDWAITPRGLSLITLDEAVAAYDEYLGPRARIAEQAAPDWFPVFGYNQAGYVVVHCDAPVGVRGQSSSWDPWFSMSDLTPADSLWEPMGWWVKFLETRQWRWADPLWIDELDPTSLTQDQLNSGLI